MTKVKAKHQKKQKKITNKYATTTNGDLAYSQHHFLQDDVKSLVALNESVTTKDDFQNAKPYLDKIFEGTNKIVQAYALIIAVHTRDIEKGKGLRKPFLEFLNYFYQKGFKTFTEKLIQHIPKYGYYKDLCKLYELSEKYKYEDLKKIIAKFYIQELKKEKELQNPNEMTNAGKFAPRQQKAFHSFAVNLAEDMFPGSKTKLKDYRKYISEIMTKYKQITEVLMSSNDWDKIDPKYVPSLCFKKYKKCFLNPESDEQKRKLLRERYEKHIEKALEGKAKVNAKRLTVNSIAYEFYNNYTKTDLEKKALEAQMLDIVNDIKKKGSVLTNALVVCDVSGSMGGSSQNDPIFGCIGLGIVIDELNRGCALGNSILTFSKNPKWVQLGDGMTYAERFQTIRHAEWGMNTDFYKTMKLIVDSAKSKKENLPKIMFVLSDMQFDQASNQSWSTCYDSITELFEDEGFDEDDIPTIVFWNLMGNKKTFTVDSSQKKVICLSGFSQALLKWIIEAKNLDDILNMTPFQFLMEILESERYAPIKKIAFQEL